MIILLNDEGQMGNQMSLYATTLAYGLEYHHDVYFPLLDEKLKRQYAFDFSEQKISVSTKKVKLFQILKFAYLVYKKVFGKEIAFREDKIVAGNNSQIIMICTWNAHNDRLLAKYVSQVRQCFAINQEIIEKCRKNMEDWNCCGRKKWVGVHIRRGDYKTFQNGELYYTDEQYAAWMTGIFREMENVKFLLVSNEELNIEYFKSLGLNVTRSQGNAIEDLCCLSMCDYIMGPPSTYSWWAGILGHVKRCELSSTSEMYELNDFMYFEETV